MKSPDKAYSLFLGTSVVNYSARFLVTTWQREHQIEVVCCPAGHCRQFSPEVRKTQLKQEHTMLSSALSAAFRKVIAVISQDIMLEVGDIGGYSRFIFVPLVKLLLARLPEVGKATSE